MTNRPSSIKTTLPIQFSTLTGDLVPATIKRIEFDAHPVGSPSSCELIFEVSGEMGQLILREQWFHLFDSVRVHDDSFESDQPIQIRAALRPNLVSYYAAHQADAEHILDALLQVSDSANMNAGARRITLHHTECWMAIELKQELSLTKELPSDTDLTGAILQSVLRTQWGQEPGASKIVHGNNRSLILSELDHLITTYLAGKGLQYDRMNDQLLRIRFHTDTERWSSLIRIDVEQQFCVLYSVVPNVIPVERREEVAAILMHQNYDLTSGSFEMDYEDGEVRFRSTIIFTDIFEVSILGYLLAEHLQTMQHYLPKLRADMNNSL